MDSVPQTLYSCPSCGELKSHETAADFFTCSSCEKVVKLSGHYCPNCFEYTEDNRASCANCSEILIRSCPQCGQTNWSGRLVCHYCGWALDLFTTASKRNSPTATADRLQAQMRQAITIRAIDDVASRRNMAELNEAEQVRRHDLRNQQKRRQRRDRQLIVAAAALMLLFVIAIVAFSLII